ncbi:MAG: methyltransferase domain-containing protein, partial [Ardenticatenaceae bacterium]
MSKKTSRDVRTDEDIRQWEARLAREWPERAQMAQYIANYVAQHIANYVAQLPVEVPVVVELAVGSGYLSEHLLRVLPKGTYIGLDRSPSLLNYAQRRLDALSPRGDYQLHLADVNED